MPKLEFKSERFVYTPYLGVMSALIHYGAPALPIASSPQAPIL